MEENQKNNPPNHANSSNKSEKDNDIFSQAGEFLKNPFVTGLGGFLLGYWMASSKYDKELESLKEEVRQLSSNKEQVIHNKVLRKHAVPGKNLLLLK